MKGRRGRRKSDSTSKVVSVRIDESLIKHARTYRWKIRDIFEDALRQRLRTMPETIASDIRDLETQLDAKRRQLEYVQTMHQSPTVEVPSDYIACPKCQHQQSPPLVPQGRCINCQQVLGAAILERPA